MTSESGKALAELMRRAGIRSAGALSRALGNAVSQPTISRLLRGDTAPDPETVARLAAHFGVAPALVRGEIPIDEPAAGVHILRRVPLYRPADMSNENTPPARSSIACPVECGPLSFAFEIEGPAMLAADRPSLAPGAIVIVDPERAPESGSLVCVRLAPGQPPTVRQYLIEAGRAYLAARNPAWPERIAPLPAAAHILGRVVFIGEAI